MSRALLLAGAPLRILLDIRGAGEKPTLAAVLRGCRRRGRAQRKRGDQQSHRDVRGRGADKKMSSYHSEDQVPGSCLCGAHAKSALQRYRRSCQARWVGGLLENVWLENNIALVFLSSKPSCRFSWTVPPAATLLPPPWHRPVRCGFASRSRTLEKTAVQP